MVYLFFAVDFTEVLNSLLNRSIYLTFSLLYLAYAGHIDFKGFKVKVSL